jgi:hypothetical protein
VTFLSTEDICREIIRALKRDNSDDDGGLIDRMSEPNLISHVSIIFKLAFSPLYQSGCSQPFEEIPFNKSSSPLLCLPIFKSLQHNAKSSFGSVVYCHS